jgi:hypothetical protein
MRLPRRCLCALALLTLMTSVAAFAAAPKIEGTPVPMNPKPDFSSMEFLIGTWQCTDLSSRRPGPFSITEVYSMDPTGNWMLRDSTTHKASWIPRDFHSQTKYTYDAAAKRWVRIQTVDDGRYTVATAPNPSANKKIYTYVIQTKAPDVASYAPEVFTKVSNTEKTMTTSFTETNGRVVSVKETCTKS